MLLPFNLFFGVGSIELPSGLYPLKLRGIDLNFDLLRKVLLTKCATKVQVRNIVLNSRLHLHTPHLCQLHFYPDLQAVDIRNIQGGPMETLHSNFWYTKCNLGKTLEHVNF